MSRAITCIRLSCNSITFLSYCMNSLSMIYRTMHFISVPWVINQSYILSEPCQTHSNSITNSKMSLRHSEWILHHFITSINRNFQIQSLLSCSLIYWEKKQKQNQSNSLVLPCNEQKISYFEDVNKRCQHLFKVNERNCCCLHFNWMNRRKNICEFASH